MRTIIALAIILTLTACATSGRKITQAQLAQVVSGQTTRGDLIAMFGPPTSEVYSSDGTQIGADGTVTGYTRTGSAPLNQTATAQPVTPQATAPASVQPQPLGEQAYKQQQVDQLMQQNLPYEEYQKRYRQIMGE